MHGFDIDKLKHIPTTLSTSNLSTSLFKLLNNLKSKVDKLDVVKLIPVHVNVSKLRNLVKNGVVTKDLYNAKITNIEDKIPDMTNVATNAFLNAKINEVKGEIPHITNLATTAALTAVGNKTPSATNISLDAQINEVKVGIPNITNLATTAALTAAGDKIPSVCNLVKKTHYNIPSEKFAARLVQANLASIYDIGNFVIS